MSPSSLDSLVRVSRQRASEIRSGGFFRQTKEAAKEILPAQDPVVPDIWIDTAAAPVRRVRVHAGYVRASTYSEDRDAINKRISDLEFSVEKLMVVASALQSQSTGHQDRYSFLLKIFGTSGFVAIISGLFSVIVIFAKRKKDG